MKTKQKVSSWPRLSKIIGHRSVRQITQTDACDTARMIIAVILDSGYSVSTDGHNVYTDHPMDEEAKAGWIAYQPALRRVFDE